MSETNQPTISYDNWTEFLQKLGGICTPAELQGMLAGTLASGQRLDNAQWVDVASGFMDLPEKEVAPERTGALVAFYDLTLDALKDDSYSFKLILPEDALPLEKRIEGLSDWCQGFLHGLGSAGEGIAAGMDEEGRELLQDIAQIAQVDIEEAESEESELHYTELVEYVRIAAINLFTELNPPQKLEENTPSTH